MKKKVDMIQSRLKPITKQESKKMLGGNGSDGGGYAWRGNPTTK